jgi:hypothetical protein
MESSKWTDSINSPGAPHTSGHAHISDKKGMYYAWIYGITRFHTTSNITDHCTYFKTMSQTSDVDFKTFLEYMIIFCIDILKPIYFTATKIPFMYFFSGNCAASVPIPQSCECERFKYSQDRSTYFPAAERQTDPGNI